MQTALQKRGPKQMTAMPTPALRAYICVLLFGFRVARTGNEKSNTKTEWLKKYFESTQTILILLKPFLFPCTVRDLLSRIYYFTVDNLYLFVNCSLNFVSKINWYEITNHVILLRQQNWSGNNR